MQERRRKKATLTFEPDRVFALPDRSKDLELELDLESSHYRAKKGQGGNRGGGGPDGPYSFTAYGDITFSSEATEAFLKALVDTLATKGWVIHQGHHDHDTKDSVVVEGLGFQPTAIVYVPDK